MKQLDYVPSTMAQNSSAGKTRNIGDFLPLTELPVFETLVTGILNAELIGQVHAVILPSRYELELERTYLEALRRTAVDGLIYSSHGLGLSKFASYTRYGPIVVCEDPGQVKLAAAYADRTPAYTAAFNWMKRTGHK